MPGSPSDALSVDQNDKHPFIDPPTRYTCFRPGCPGDHPSRWSICVATVESSGPRELLCRSGQFDHPSAAHKAACPICNPTKTVPELNAAFAASSSNEMSVDQLRAAAALVAIELREARAEIERLTAQLDSEAKLHLETESMRQSIIAGLKDDIERLTRELNDAMQGEADATTSYSSENSRLRTALMAAKEGLLCRGEPNRDHYCPNCDNSMYKVREVIEAALSAAPAQPEETVLSVVEKYREHMSPEAFAAFKRLAGSERSGYQAQPEGAAIHKVLQAIDEFVASYERAWGNVYGQDRLKSFLWDTAQLRKKIEQALQDETSGIANMWQCESCRTFNPLLDQRCQKCGAPKASDDEPSTIGARLIVSAEEAARNDPLCFRHWSKDPFVPYQGCHCGSCVEAREEGGCTNG